MLYGELMARYVTTIPSSLTQQEAFAYMADLHNFAKWDKGVVKVVQVEGSGAGLGTIFDVTVKVSENPLQHCVTPPPNTTSSQTFWCGASIPSSPPSIA